MQDIIGERMSMWWHRKVVSNTLLKCLGMEARAFNRCIRPFNLQLSLHNIALLALLRREEEQNPAATSLPNSSIEVGSEGRERRDRAEDESKEGRRN
jgi:hypothetical protein